MVMLTFCATQTRAQNIHADTLKTQLIKDWQRAKVYTMEYLAAMPDDKYSWQPQKEVRSFAAQMLHFSWITVGFVSNGTGQKRELLDADLTKPLEETIPHTKEAVTKYVSASYDFAIEGLQRMKASELLERGKNRELKLSWINKAFEHQTHHRGQCTLYLRLAGVTPPHEKLF